MIEMTQQALLAAGVRAVSSRELYPAHHQPNETGLPMLIVENPLARALIALQGAHVMAFRPEGKDEMLWVSPKTALREGVPIRGGIPLCLPWFGPGPDGKTLHGFARLEEWRLIAAESLAHGGTLLTLELTGAATRALWPHAFCFCLKIEIGAALKISIEAQNRDAEAVPLAFAFHTYFAVPDVAAAQVSGLDGAIYVDKTDHFARKTQTGDVTINAVTDRVYLDVLRRQAITAGKRRIDIESDTRCAVVWNAWSNDRNIPDLGEGSHVGYLCVERGDVADHAVILPSGGSYQATMTLSEG